MNFSNCTVFLADSLEPGRLDNTEDLQTLRQISCQNLYIQAVWLTCDYSLEILHKPFGDSSRTVATPGGSCKQSKQELGGVIYES